MFYKIIFKASVVNFFSKIPRFHHFIWTRLDGCDWSMKIILWEAPYFRNANNIQSTETLLQKLSMEIH